MNIRRRNALVIIIDLIFINLSFFIALWLRFDGKIPEEFANSYKELAPYYTVVLLGSFYSFGLYRKLWQYASLGELLSIVYSITFGVIFNISLAYFFMKGHAYPLPRSVFMLSWMALIILIGGSRLSWRIFRDNHLHKLKIHSGKPVLIVGAGDAGAAVARELNNIHNIDGSVPIGFVDDNPKKLGMEMFGLKVLGGRENIPKLVEDYNIKEIVIAIPSAPGRIIREIVTMCKKTTANLKILPGIYELINGTVSINQIREVQLEDLLGREPVEVDMEAIAGYLKGKTILVTGAGGSIGSELCRQIAQFQPSQLIMLGHGENSIYQIHNEIIYKYHDINVIPVIADVKDKFAMIDIFKRYKPQVVFHAAAHKHVPLMEFNPVEAIKNNVIGTYNVATAADQYGTGVFILISTDKAVNPTSIMGATKRIAEMIIQKVGLDSSTRYAAVRFGNVLGSRGSVVPLFREQIARGGPVTVTHPEMTRYFMTIPEAVQLVIQSGSLTRGGEIFVLDMGEPLKITDLARSMIQLSGFEPDEDIEIIFTGIRPGEKLYEELLTDNESLNSTLHDRIFINRLDKLHEWELEGIVRLIEKQNFDIKEDDVVHLLHSVIPSYKGKSLLYYSKDKRLTS